MADSLIGRKLGQYKVTAELGRGQHTIVYKAWQSSLERDVTLKILRHYSQDTLSSFQAEARLTAQLVQQGVPNIRQVYEVAQTPDGYLYVAMEFVEDSLRSLLRRAQKRNQRLRPLAATRLLEPVARSLDALHSLGWVHLDIKPQNILISKGGRAVLADFGIAQRRGMMTHACTPAYASPEQAAGDRPVGPWSDIYSLGVVLYEMVAGHPPVRGDQDIVLLNQHLEVTPPSPRRVNPRLTSSQEHAIYKALAKSPQDRFRTAGELVGAMMEPETFLSSVIQTPSMLFDRRTSLPRRLARGLLVLIVAGLLVGLLVVAGRLLIPALLPGTATVSPTLANTMASTPILTTVPSSTAIFTSTPTKTPLPPTPTHPPTATLAPTRTREPTNTRTPLPTAAPEVTVTGSPSP